MLARRLMIGMVLGGLAAGDAAGPALADDCVGATLWTVTSGDASYRLDVRTVGREGCAGGA